MTGVARDGQGSKRLLVCADPGPTRVLCQPPFTSGWMQGLVLRCCGGRPQVQAVFEQLCTLRICP
jgi:hypothetical protein